MCTVSSTICILSRASDMGFSKFARMFSALGRVETLAIELSDAKARMQGDQDRLQIVRRGMQDVS